MPSLPPEAQPERLLIATRNPGKFAEYQDLLSGLPYKLTTLGEEGISLAVEESGATYEENARLKAESYVKASGLLTLADDSGLEVDALAGQPGPGSARYGGPGLSDAHRGRLLLRNLTHIPPPLRTARFVCVIAILAPHRTPHLVRGECQGVIAPEPRGASGFGYDPVFYFPELRKTLAELPLKEKNAVSHRGKAAQAAREVLLDLAKGA